MKFSTAGLVAACFTLHLPESALAQSACSTTMAAFESVSTGTCISGWSKGNTYQYPGDFNGILNQVKIYKCETSGKRVIISNGIPDHAVTQGNPNSPCQKNWAIEMPLNPVVASAKTEVPVRAIIAMAINGVPAFGAQELEDTNAVEPGASSSVTDAQFWYGHASK
jgi:hypothetical protein